MPVYRIPEALVFPHPTLSDPGACWAWAATSGGQLLLGYAGRIFPWFQGQPILWFSPDPRFVLPVAELRVPRSLRKRVRRGDYQVTLDRAFPASSQGARQPIDRASPAPGSRMRWRRRTSGCTNGVAHSVEAWRGSELVGGLYGVALGRLFSGNMFATASDASKVAFVVGEAARCRGLPGGRQPGRDRAPAPIWRPEHRAEGLPRHAAIPGRGTGSARPVVLR